MEARIQKAANNYGQAVQNAVQKDNAHPPLVALPVSLALAEVPPVCSPVIDEGWSLTPPAAGPPATLRFCRFRE